jgi:hypothetical protein
VSGPGFAEREIVQVRLVASMHETESCL